jgi:hypothetical protein
MPSAATLAVVFKVAFALQTNEAAVIFLNRVLPPLIFVPGVALYVGSVSAAFEIGLTWFAARRWRFLGSGPNRAIAIGVGAEAIEALVLGLSTLAPYGRY